MLGLARSLRGLSIERPNQAWAADTTYLPLPRGFLYLAKGVALDIPPPPAGECMSGVLG